MKKITGEYSFIGTVVAAFVMLGGAERYVVEHQEHHMLHIFNEKNLDYAVLEKANVIHSLNSADHNL